MTAIAGDVGQPRLSQQVTYSHLPPKMPKPLLCLFCAAGTGASLKGLFCVSGTDAFTAVPCAALPAARLRLGNP